MRTLTTPRTASTLWYQTRVLPTERRMSKIVDILVQVNYVRVVNGGILSEFLYRNNLTYFTVP